MKHKLTDIEITRVALVAKGSNPKADILFYKSDDTKETPHMKIEKIDRSKLSKEEKSSLEALLKKAGVEETENPPEPTPEEVLKANPAVQKMVDDAIAAQKKAEKEASDTKAKLKKIKADPDDEDDEDEEAQRTKVLKEMTPAARAMFQKLEKDAQDAKDVAAKAQKEAESATATAKLEKEAREEERFVKDAEAFTKAYPGKADDTGSVLFRVKKAVKKEDYDKLVVVLKAGNEALAKLATEIGEDSRNENGEAFEKLQAAAKEIRKDNPKWTYEKAFDKACEDNPDLVREYQKGLRRRRREADDDE